MARKKRLNAVERSLHREEIEERLVRGDSDRVVSKWLEDTYGEVIGYLTIYKHRKMFLNDKREAVAAYNKRNAEAMMRGEITRQVSMLEYCDEIIKLAHAVGLKVDDSQKITELDIKKLGLDAVKVKHNLTRDSASTKIINNNLIIPLDPEFRKKGRKLIREIRAEDLVGEQSK